MDELFDRDERRGESVSLIFVWVAVSITLFALLASVWHGETAPDLWRTIAILAMGLIIVVNQLRVYRVVRHAARHNEPTLDEITAAVAELIASDRRDFQRMYGEMEASLLGRLEGTVVSLEERKLAAEPAV